MAIKYLERTRFSTATTSTGSMIVGAAVGASFMTPAQAGGADADQMAYVIEEGDDFEIGVGTLSSSAAVLSRDTVIKSMIAGVIGTTKMSLLGNALVRSVLPAALTMRGPNATVTDGAMAVWDGTSGTRQKAHASGLPGTAAFKDTGTSGATVPLLNGANTFSAVQIFDYPVKATPFALTTATAWDGTVHQALTVAISGADFAIANPSSYPAAGVYVSAYVAWASAHNLTWGNGFKGITSYVGSGNGKHDHLTFRSTGTTLELVGLSQDIGA